ncbi:MFS transporter [Denitrobaculum tricleocarpae]|uniref:MFS transporter n=1 Tax=Denitrobaculum tricleocarpae TaxID=2591009 RepID=UPI0015D435E3|nr:MFS transporter [Denitrobaculum tricleocarpae]
MSDFSMMFRRAGWLLVAAPFFGLSTGALFPLVALELDRLGFGETFVGSATSLYYAGSVTGALTYGWILNRIGYKPAFFITAALAGAATFALAQSDNPYVWLGLRYLGGYALGGYYIVVDSWVSALGTRQTRGRLFASFETLRLLATAIGPSLIVVGSATENITLIAFAYALSFAPALLNVTPTLQARGRKLSGDVAGLVRCFPFALAVAFCGGIANASFYGLSAVYAKAIGFDTAQIALFVGAVLVAPAIISIPVGAIGDRFGRMRTVMLIAGCSALACGFTSIAQPATFWITLVMSVVSGGCLVPLYAISLSRVVDAVGERDAIPATTAGLLVYNMGAFCGPALAGLAMEWNGPAGFYIFLGAVALFAILLANADMRLAHCCPEAPEPMPGR